MDASFHTSSPSLTIKTQSETQHDEDKRSLKGAEMSLGLNSSVAGGDAKMGTDSSITGSLKRTPSIEKYSSLKKDMSGSLLIFDDTNVSQSFVADDVTSLNTTQDVSKLTAENMHNTLKQNLAYLLGAQDYGGSPVVLVPSRIMKQDIPWPTKSLADTLIYFSAITKPDNKENGFTVIVDIRGTFGKFVKSVAGYFAGVSEVFHTKQIIFIKADDFFEKQIANFRIRTKKNREIPIFFVSSKKLNKFVDKRQLSSEVGGSIAYNHRMWINNRLDFESFVKQADAILNSLNNQQDPTPSPEFLKTLINDCVTKGDELLKRLVNLPDKESLEKYEPESCDQRDMRSTVDWYIAKLIEVGDPKGHSKGTDASTQDSTDGLDLLGKKKDLSMSEKREKLEILIDETIKFIDWTRNDGDKLVSGMSHNIGKDGDEAAQLLNQLQHLKIQCEPHFTWLQKLRGIADYLIGQSYRVEKVTQIQADLTTAHKATLGKIEAQDNLLNCSIKFHRFHSSFLSASKSLARACEETSLEDFWIIEDCEKVISEAGQLYVTTEQTFDQLEAEGDYVIDQLGSFKEQGPDTATSRKQIRNFVTESAEILETVVSDYNEWNKNMKKFMEILVTENEIRSIIMNIESSFSSLAQTLQEDLTNGSNEFRSVFAAREPPTRDLYTRGLDLIKKLTNLRENLNLTQEKTEEIEEELTATWKNFFIQLAENGSEDSVLEICWMLMVQNWKLVERLFKDLHDNSGDAVALRKVKSKNLDYRSYVNVSYTQTEVIISTFIERLTMLQRNGKVLNNEEITELRSQLESMTEMKLSIDESYANFISQKDAYNFFQVCIETCDWVRIRITEMVPGMLEIGANLIEALDLYRIHQEFIEKIENRHEEIREVLRKADVMVESTDEGQSQVYQAMAISLKDAWKELMMRMEERKILLEMAIGFYRSGDDYHQHLEYAFAVCNSTLIADNIEQVQVLIEEHQEMKKMTAQHAMTSIQSGQELIDKIVDIGRNLESSKGSNDAVMASNNVEKLLAELHDRRSILEELWLQRKIRLEQSLLIFQLDSEIQHVTSWFLTSGADNMHHVDLGNNPTETNKLIEIHQDFTADAKLIEARITRVLRSVDTLILTGHEDGDNLRERVGEIESLNRDILQKIEDRRKRLGLTMEFWSSASKAFDRLTEIEEQIEETLSTPDSPKLDSKWKPDRLAKLSQAVLESTTPAVREGHIILDKSTVGADGVKYIVEKLKERCVPLCGACSKIRNERSTLFVSYDEKYSVITTWLVNIGLDLLSRRKALGVSVQDASDFFDHHLRLKEDLKSRYVDVESCANAVESMEVNEESEASEARMKVEELKSRWRTLIIFTEQRILLAETFLQFLERSVEMVNLMDTLEELLKLENWNLDRRTLEGTRRIWMEKFRVMNETYETVYYKGRCFLKDSKTQTLNDKQLNVIDTVTFVEQQLELFEERRRVINDLWDTWKLRTPFTGDITTQWDLYSTDTSKSLSWIVQIQKRLFAPLVIGDPKHCRQTAYVMKDRLAEIKICYKRVTSEVERWLKVGEMLNIKEDPTKPGDSSANQIASTSATTSEDLQKVPQQLISEHKSFQTLMQLYDVHISDLVSFLLALAELYDVIDTTYAEVEKAKKSEDAEYIIEVLKLLDSTKENEIKLYKSTLDNGEKFLAAVDSKHDQPAKKEAQTILANLKLDHEHWLTWCQECCEDLQDKIHAATTSNRTLYILQCIDQFWSELRNMEGAYGDGTENLQEIAGNFELWLQDLMSFGENEYNAFLEKTKDADPSEEANINRCRNNWNNLQKDVEKHKSHLELAREYHILLDELESLSLEYRDVVVKIARQTCDANEASEIAKLKENLENCEQKVNKNYRSKLDRVYELAKRLFDPIPKYLDNLWTRKTDLGESINTVRTEIRVKMERFTWTEEETVQRVVTTSETLFSLPNNVPPKTPPKIITGLQDCTTKKGEPANFSCVLYGSEPMKVKWQKDGKRLIDSSSSIEIKAAGQSHSLKIPSTSIEDIGTITVIAENDFGKTNSSAYLHVQGPHGKPPSFVKAPEAMCKLDEGSPIRLEAQVAGMPTPDCIWYKNGREVIPDDRIKLRSTPEGVHQLIINETTPSDSGDYTVCAINDCGETSKTSKVTVEENGVPPHLITDLRDLEIEEGKQLRWEIELEGNPKPLVKWFKDNEDMSQFDCEIEHVGSTCALILEEVFPEDEGNYMIVASNIHGAVQSSARLIVAIKGEPPKFVKKPNDVDVKEGEEAEFSCKVTGYPAPEVKWYHKDGEELKDGEDFLVSCKNGTSKLLIGEVIPEDAGKIVCRAVNKMGEASATVYLTVNTRKKPFFEVPIADCNCRELEPVNFECKISGEPKPTIQWLHNGEKIIPDNKTIKITASGNKHSLTIKECQYADRGVYKVVAKNSEGEEGCTAFLDVEELPNHLKPHPPRIESQMASQLHATEGERITLECEISANPVPEITWYKDRNQRIKPGADLQITQVGSKCVLRILSSITEDSGLYTLHAKNKFGETSVSCNIYIKEKTPEPEAPEFELGLKETIAKEGTSATFECIVKGIPSPTVAWYLNGEKLTEGPDQQIRRNEFNHLLKLQNLEIDDTGPVTVTASNIAGTVSSTAPLIVQMREKKPVLIQPLTSVKVKLGEEALMSCKVANLSNKCEVRVLKDDKLAGDDSKIQLIDGGKDCLVVKIPDVTVEDEGQFCVEVSNSAGTVSSSGFCQVVERGSEPVKPSLIVTDETDAVLQTDLDDMFENVEVYLPIHEVPNKFGSTRSITKSEDVITKKSTVQLESNLEPPVFISELLQPPIVEVGQNVLLEIIIRGVPDPEVEWLKDDKKVDPKRCRVSREDGKCSLEILKATATDEGEYSIVAKNSAGIAQCTCQLLIDDSSNAPIFTERLSTKEVECGQSLEMQASVRGNPEPKVTWHLNGEVFRPTKGDSITQEGPRHKCFIKSISKENAGQISVIAENERGKATSSAEIIVTDLSVVPKFVTPLKNVTQPEGFPLKLSCQLNLPCKVTWLKDNQPIRMTNNKYDVTSQNNEHSLSVNKPSAADSGQYSVRAVSDGKKSSSTSCDVVIQAIREAPLIRKKLEDLTIIAGETATFEVDISGDPEPEITWYRDGAKIVSSKDFQITKYGTRHSLCIPEVFPEDHGTFSVEAKNVAGTDKSSATLNIRDPELETQEEAIEGPHFSALSSLYSTNIMSMIPLSISKHLDPVDVREGSPAALQCELQGYPSEGIVVTWTKDGVEVDRDPNYNFTFEHGVARCFISECFPEDSGTWTCCFRHVNGNENDVIASSTTLICREAQEPKLQRSHEDAHLDSLAPEFIKPLAHQRMVEGGHAMFQCMVSGYPPPDIKWMKNNQILQSGYRYKIMNDTHSGNCSLSISFLLPDEDYGTYTCIASNVKGQVSTEASLLDEEAYKQYLTELQKKEFVGELTDRVRARSPVMYKNNQKKDVYVPRYEMNLAKNVHRRLESLSSPGEESVTSPMGDRLVPMPRHPGTVTRKLPTDFNVTNFEDRLLSEIEFPADRLDSGHPSAESIEAEFNTPESEMFPPSFMSRIQGSKLFEGTKTAFECVLKGNPSPKVDWFYNGHQIFNSQRVSVFREPRDPKTGLTKAVMKIVPVLLDDTGFYTVLARNHRGRIVCSAQLQVMKKRLPAPPSSAPAKDAFPASPPPPPSQPVENNKLSKPLQALEDRNKKLESGPPVQSGVAEKHLAPCFTKKSIDVHAKQGKTARFDCNVAGRPTPTLTWYHEGRLITTEDPNRKSTIREDGTYSLIFQSVHLSDGGQYECVATNKGGEARFMVRLIVDENSAEEAPHIIEKPAHSLKVDEGEPLAFRIRVTGYPEPTFSIVKDGVKRDPLSPVFGNPDFERPTVEKLGVGYYQIYFPHGVFKEDGGWYTCGARNPIGSDTFSFKINVNALLSPNLDDDKPKPVKISIPKRKTPLPPLPSEPPKPSYVKEDEWNDDELFTSAKPHQAPRFKKFLQDNSIVEGSKTFLECTVMPAGDPTMEVEWFKDGRPILHGTRMKPIFEFGFCVLEFDDVWDKDGGLYTCRATNKSGQAEVSCRIAVMTNKCLIDESHLPQNEAKPLKPSSPIKQASRPPGTAQIYVPSEPHKPSYVKKDEWNDDELFTSAKPPQAPRFKKFLQDNSIVEGNKTFLECTVMPAGDPTMKVEWFKDGRPILHGTRMKPIFEFGFCVLEFDDVWAKDGGLYTCKATNQVGQAEVSCRIAVKTTKCLIEESQLPEDMQTGYQQLNAWELAKNNSTSGGYEDDDPAAPMIVQYPEDVDIQEGMTAKFMCRIVGNPVPSVFWYRNQQLLSNSQRISAWYDGIHRLEIARCKQSDSGSVVLIARNQFGEVRHDNSLMVRKKSVVQMSKVSHKAESQVMMKFVSTSDSTASNGQVQTGSYYGN